MKKVLITLALAIPIVFIFYMGVKNTNPRFSKSKSETINELEEIYMNQLLPKVRDVIHQMDTAKTKAFINNYQPQVDDAVYEFINKSSQVYMSLCNIGEQNYNDEEVVNEVYTLTEKILSTQLGLVKVYCSVDIVSSCLKIIDDELARLHHIGGYIEQYTLDEVIKILNS